jgi:hypothetical protein
MLEVLAEFHQESRFVHREQEESYIHHARGTVVVEKMELEG